MWSISIQQTKTARSHSTYFMVWSSNRPLVASGIVSAFKSILRDSWGPRMEYILYAAIAALLDCENVSLLGIQRMLVDSRYRSWVLRQAKDSAVLAFWLDELRDSLPEDVDSLAKRTED